MYVYMMTNKSRHPFYTGVTNDVVRRSWEHKQGWCIYTERYKLFQLIYYERWRNPDSAIAREKRVKRMSRAEKMQLVLSMNPGWKDLSAEWHERHRYQPDAVPSQTEPRDPGRKRRGRDDPS